MRQRIDSLEDLQAWGESELIEEVQRLQSLLNKPTVVRDSAIETHHGTPNSEVRWIRTVFCGTHEIDKTFMSRQFASKERAEEFSRFLYERFQTPAFDQIEANFWNDGSRDYYEKGVSYERKIG